MFFLIMITSKRTPSGPIQKLTLGMYSFQVFIFNEAQNVMQHMSWSYIAFSAYVQADTNTTFLGSESFILSEICVKV